MLLKMKKHIICSLAILCVLVLTGFTFFPNENSKEKTFNIEDLYDYHKEYKTEEIQACATKGAKTYMDYRMTTVVNSKQYQFIHNKLTVDKKTGFLYDAEGFIAVALGSYYGTIGDRFYFTLDSGVVLPLVKAEEKADKDTDPTGCYHLIDTSIIEFVIDDEYAGEFFWNNGNGLVLNGNYNNYPLFSGDIVKVEKVLEEKSDKIISYSINTKIPEGVDIFNYASGY